MASCGYILYDKPSGLTSFTALRGMRASFGPAKVGHAGTLDSFATGLLLVLVGSYSRLVPWLVGLDKVYEAEFEFGTATDTLDPVGTVVATSDLPDAARLQAAIPTLVGPQMQLPPDYSAIHVGGRRASDIARKGVSPQLEAREITVYSLELLEYSGKTCKVRIHCSSGTYVRAIARDLAAACGSVAHVKRLRRISIGPFNLQGSANESTADFHAALRLFTPKDARSIGLGLARIPGESERAFTHGAPFLLEKILGKNTDAKNTDMAAFGADDRFLGIIGRRDSSPSYLMVVPSKDGVR